MIRANIGNHPDRGPDNLTEPGRLPLLIHPHLNDGRLIASREPQQGVGYAYPIVEIPLGL